MSILDFQRPDKVYMIESTDFHGNFEFRPLEPGYGLTIGNALRRVLLSSLEGFAITSIKIEGVEHEFSSIKGVVEDVTGLNVAHKIFDTKTMLKLESFNQSLIQDFGIRKPKIACLSTRVPIDHSYASIYQPFLV